MLNRCTLGLVKASRSASAFMLGLALVFSGGCDKNGDSGKSGAEGLSGTTSGTLAIESPCRPGEASAKVEHTVFQERL